MLKNYFKTAFRNFRRHKGSFFINVTGLAIGMASSILILLWVMDELNYDHFHTNSERIFRVMEHQDYSGEIFTTTSTPGILAPALKEEIPEVEYATTYTWNMDLLFTKGDKSLKESGIYARPELVLFEAIRADYDLVESLGFRMAEGRSFSREYGTDSTKVILNEAAIEIMGMEEPLGQTISFWGDDWEIIGVLEDFNYQHLRNNVEPLFMILQPDITWEGFVRLQSDEIKRTIQELESIYKQFNPDYPFDYKFMDQQYAALYQSEMRVGDLSKYFSIFAILISCLGLLGLSAFTAEQRTREIGIRKVLGASVQNLVLLLTKDFTNWWSCPSYWQYLPPGGLWNSG